jgi:hypothetical protein
MEMWQTKKTRGDLFYLVCKNNEKILFIIDLTGCNLGTQNICDIRQ